MSASMKRKGRREIERGMDAPPPNNQIKFKLIKFT